MKRHAALELLIVGILGLLAIGGVVLASNTDNSAASSTGQAAPTAIATPAGNPAGVPPGELIAVPAFEHRDIKLVAVAETPLISLAEAMQTIHDFGIPWGLGGEWEGQPVTPAGYYGLATFGSPGPQGAWIGDRNIPLPDGSLLDHIENRPMWIITYSNTPFYGGGCPECPPADFNNTAYAIDAQTKAVWLVWGFKTP